MTIDSRKHIQSLDGLRGIAILLVILYHYLPRNPHNPLSIAASLGWSGVDLFFVLSGFLITGILYDTRNSSGRFRAFYVRRALRLLPLYGLAVAIVLIGTHGLQGHRSWLNLPFFLYCANIVLVIPHSVTTFPPYFDCQHFWSLALEEQFYSIWPFVVFLVPVRRTLMRIAFVCLVTALAIRIIMVAFGWSTWIVNTQLPTRMDSLLMGAMLALAIRGNDAQKWLNPKNLKLAMVAGLLGLIGVLITARTFFWSSAPMSSVGYTLVAETYACILAFALIPGSISNRVGSNRLLRFFGKYSYGLYVWHFLLFPLCSPSLGFFRQMVHPPWLADLVYQAAILAFFTGIAVSSYWLIEIRFLRLKRKFTADNAPRSVSVS